MASLMMHLYVGWKFAKQHATELNLPQFFLGCIAPDSVNVDGFAPKEKRWPAHLRSSNLQQWYENNLNFYRSNAGHMCESLLLGYVIHNITDAAFDEFYVKQVDEALTRHGNAGGRWDDCFRYDHSQLGKAWWAEEVLPALKRATPQAVNGLDVHEMARFLQGIVKNNWATTKGEPVVVTDELVDGLAKVVCHKLS